MITSRKLKWCLIAGLSFGIFAISYAFHKSTVVDPVEDLIGCLIAGWFLVICYFVCYGFGWILFRTPWVSWDTKGSTPLLWVTLFLFVSNGVNVYALH
jgi:hypothetical protein